MMNENEKRDFLESARSAELRRDFEVLRRNSFPANPKNVDLDAYLQFLKDFARAFPQSGGSDRMTGGNFRI